MLTYQQTLVCCFHLARGEKSRFTGLKVFSYFSANETRLRSRGRHHSRLADTVELGQELSPDHQPFRHDTTLLALCSPLRHRWSCHNFRFIAATFCRRVVHVYSTNLRLLPQCARWLLLLLRENVLWPRFRSGCWCSWCVWNKKHERFTLEAEDTGSRFVASKPTL